RNDVRQQRMVGRNDCAYHFLRAPQVAVGVLNSPTETHMASRQWRSFHLFQHRRRRLLPPNHSMVIFRGRMAPSAGRATFTPARIVGGKEARCARPEDDLVIPAFPPLCPRRLPGL